MTLQQKTDKLEELLRPYNETEVTLEANRIFFEEEIPYIEMSSEMQKTVLLRHDFNRLSLYKKQLKDLDK